MVFACVCFIIELCFFRHAPFRLAHSLHPTRTAHTQWHATIDHSHLRTAPTLGVEVAISHLHLLTLALVRGAPTQYAYRLFASACSPLLLTSPAHLACSPRLLPPSSLGQPSSLAPLSSLALLPLSAALALRNLPSELGGDPILASHGLRRLPARLHTRRLLLPLMLLAPGASPKSLAHAAASSLRLLLPSSRRSCLVRRLLACSTTARWSSTWRFVIMRLDCCFLFAFRVFCLPKAAALVLRPTFSFSFFLYVFFFLLRIFVTNRNANRTTAVRPAAPKHN